MEIVPSEGKYEFVVEDGLIESLKDDRFFPSIIKGVEKALKEATKENDPIKIHLLEADDITGESVPYAFEQCGYGAINVFLGLSHKNDPQGLIDDPKLYLKNKHE